MKNNFFSLLFLVTTISLFLPMPAWGQSPEKINYQAVLHNNSNELIKDQQVGMRVSILQGSVDGIAVYVETQTPVTNSRGIITIRIGTGDVESGDFSAIDWSAGPYFLKTEIDPEGGTNYSLTGTSQLVSVPYALYAQKAGNVFSGDYNDLNNTPDLSGFITSESDPVFTASPANNIAETDIVNWNNKLDSFTETDPVFATSVAYGISQSDTAAWNSKLDGFTETDPLFNNSVARGITQDDTSAWNNKLDSYTESDPVFISSVANGITQNDTSAWNNKLDNYTETDPVFMASPANDITPADTTKWSTAYNWGDHAAAGYDTSRDSWTGDTATYTMENVGIGTSSPTSKLTVNGTIETTTGGIKFPDGTTQTTAAPQHYVGELYGGGIVFYVYDNGRHGLIASLQDLDDGSGVPWGLSGTDVPDCESAWDGAANTSAIIAAGGAATDAAGLCYYYTGGGFNDWYLPAAWEINVLYINAFVIAKVLETDADPLTHGLRNSRRYWSSTEVDATYALPVLGYEATDNLKTNDYGVRAVRSF